MHRTRLLLLFFLSCLIHLAKAEECFEAVNPIPGKHPLTQIMAQQQGIYGIDVSHHQGLLDWQRIKETGIAFAYVKATEGEDWVDRCFYYNWQQMAKAGIIRGAYHFFRGHTDPIAQAQFFIKTVKPVFTRFDLPPVLDVEETFETRYLPAALYAARMKTWLLYVERELGVKPLIYTNPHFWHTYLKDYPEFSRYPLWLGVTQRAPFAPTPWENWLIWQFSHQGKLEGLSNAFDLNIFSGDSQEFVRFMFS